MNVAFTGFRSYKKHRYKNDALSLLTFRLALYCRKSYRCCHADFSLLEGCGSLEKYSSVRRVMGVLYPRTGSTIMTWFRASFSSKENGDIEKVRGEGENG